jgi:dipeptidyl aminopeptidase/acylaminoacyl peptidase
MDSHGKHVTSLTTGVENEQDPNWSPDGTKIAYTDQPIGGTSSEIWVMNADGSGKTQLTSAPGFNENPNWSPDGSRLVFDSDRVAAGDLDLYSMAADGTDVKRLTSSPALDALPAYSPDGKQIVFVSDRLQKDSRRLFVMPATGGKPKRLITGDQPEFQMVPDWQRIRTGVLDKAAVPPGALLLTAGVTNTVDPLYDLDDAWSVQLTAGVTYRFNLTPSHGCAGVALYAPGMRSFKGARPLVTENCGGYFTYTPGPNKSGTYTVRVTAQPNTDAIVTYRLQSAPARPDDQGPGITLVDGQTRTGSVSGRGLDVVDLYRFQVLHPSVVRLGLDSGASLSLALTSLSGSEIAQAQAGTELVKTLEPATYLVAVKASGRTAGSYRLNLLVRAVTKTTITVGTARKVTIPVGQSVVLKTATTPAPAGGQVAIRLDYEDPLAGWVFRKLWQVAPEASVTFTPPSVGTWRVIASFRGTRFSNPSRAEYTTIVVT